MAFTKISEGLTQSGSKIDRRSWKMPIAFAIVSLISGVLFIGFAEDAPTGFDLSTGTDPVSYTHLTLPTNREV